MRAVSSSSPHSLSRRVAECALWRQRSVCAYTGSSYLPHCLPPAPASSRQSAVVADRLGKSTVAQHICLAFEGDTQRERATCDQAESSILSAIQGEGAGRGLRGEKVASGQGAWALRRVVGGMVAWGSLAVVSLLVSSCDKRPSC